MKDVDRVVGIGEYVITNNREDVIKTYALASCVAITIYSPVNCVAAMAHIVLPYHKDVFHKVSQPCYYAETAIPLLIRKMCLEYGCRKNELLIELFGGARSIKGNDMFHVGYQNITMIERILQLEKLRYTDREIGGTNSRTVIFDVATGKKKVITQPLII